MKKKRERIELKNITINIPENYDKNIQYLISEKIVASRSGCLRIAIQEFLDREFGGNLELLGVDVKQ